MRKLAILLLFAAVSCSKDAGIDTTPVTPAEVVGQSEVLFISRRLPNSADWQMFRMNPDGSNQVLVTDLLVRCAPPVPSHSTSKIAFVTYENNIYHLYVIDRNGQNLKLLSSAQQYISSPAWSADDSTIAFVKNELAVGHETDIFSVKVDGTNETRLTNQHNCSSPVFAGNAIMYINEKDIYIMNRDGSNRQVHPRIPRNRSFGIPVVSPDGSKFALVAYDQQGSQIYVINADGSNLKQITFTASPTVFPGSPREGNSNPVWSPDSKAIAYVSYENGNPDIFTIRPDGSGKKEMTNAPLRDESPCWTRDGQYLLFSSNRGPMTGSAEIYIMKANGDSQTPLTNYIADDIYPVLLGR